MSLASAQAAHKAKPKVKRPPKTKRSSLPTKPGKKRKLGRPSTYSEELVKELCMRIAKRESMNAVLSDPRMPSWDTIYTWREKYPEFAAKLAHAREIRGEARVARIDDITDDVLAGRIDPNVGRVAITAEQWAAGRESKAYSDRVEARLANPDGTPLQQASSLDLAKALAAALQSRALPAPEPIEVESTEVPVEQEGDR
jgi:hypothetical protein